MDTIVKWLRAQPRLIRDGLAGARDLLLWGRLYPRTIDLRTLGEMRRR